MLISFKLHACHLLNCAVEVNSVNESQKITRRKLEECRQVLHSIDQMLRVLVRI